MDTNWICTTTQKVQSDIRTLVERKVLRLEHQFPKGCMDNLDKSVDKLGVRAPQPLQLQVVYMVREGGLEPPHLSAPDPKSGVSTNSTTLATISI